MSKLTNRQRYSTRRTWMTSLVIRILALAVTAGLFGAGRRLSLTLRGYYVLANGFNASSSGTADQKTSTHLWISFIPKEVETLFHNPHMGWVYIDNAIPGQIDAGRSLPYVNDGTAWQEVDSVAVLSSWGQIEIGDGVYDWRLVDQAVDFWTQEGKEIHLRLSTDPMVISPLNFMSGVPEWLYDRGLPYMLREEAGVIIKYPDYRHPLYFPHLKRFLNALAEHFRNNPAVTLIDLRGYGTWGEWHSGHDMNSLAERRDILIRIVDTWADAFAGSGKYLLLSDTYEWRTEIKPAGISINQTPKPTYQRYLEASAFDYAYLRPEVSLRRDGLAGYVFEEYDGRHMREFFRSTRRPIVLELSSGITGFASGIRPGYTPRRAIDEALMYHPNYLTMLGWDLVAFTLAGNNPEVDGALYFYNHESQGLMQYALSRMGYRLVVTQGRLPRAVGVCERDGAPMLQLRLDWENRANGRLYTSYYLAVYLLADGRVVWSGIDRQFDPTTIVRGETYVHESSFTLPEDLQPGLYDLRVALVDENGTPAISLAIAGDDGSKRYLVARSVQVPGDMEVRKPVPADGLSDKSLDGGKEGESASQRMPNRQRVAHWDFATGALPQALEVDQAHVSGGVGYLRLNPSGADQGKADLVWTRPGVFRPAGGDTYIITFKYRPVTRPNTSDAEDQGYYYFLARTAKGGFRATKGETRWLDEPGAPPVTKTVVLTLGQFDDYQLVWGTYRGGTIDITEITVERVAANAVWFEDFETLDEQGGSGLYRVVADRAHVIDIRAISGRQSLAAARSFGLGSDDEDFDFLESNPVSLPLKSHTSYTVAFSFRQHNPRSFGSYYYVAVRSPSESQTATVPPARQFEWMELPDWEVHRKTFTFQTGEASDYRLVFGLHNGGDCAIDDITLIENGPTTG